MQGVFLYSLIYAKSGPKYPRLTVGKGSVNVYLTDVNGIKVPVTFSNVLLVPNLERLISISQLTENKDVEVNFKNKSALLKISGREFNFGILIFTWFQVVPFGLRFSK